MFISYHYHYICLNPLMYRDTFISMINGSSLWITFLTLPRFDKVLYNMISIHQFTQTHAHAALSIMLYHKKRSIVIIQSFFFLLPNHYQSLDSP